MKRGFGKRGDVEISFLGWVAISILGLLVIFFAYLILTGKLSGLAEMFENLGRLGRWK